MRGHQGHSITLLAAGCWLSAVSSPPSASSWSQLVKIVQETQPLIQEGWRALAQDQVKGSEEYRRHVMPHYASLMRAGYRYAYDHFRTKVAAEEKDGAAPRFSGIKIRWELATDEQGYAHVKWKLDQPEVTIRVKAPQGYSHPTIFFPGQDELVAARIVSAIGHEYGHIYHEFRKDKTWPSSRTVNALSRGCIGLLSGGALLLGATLLIGYELPPAVYASAGLGAVGGGVGLYYLRQRMLAVRRKNEQQADAFALEVLPEEVRPHHCAMFVEWMCECALEEEHMRDCSMGSQYTSRLTHFWNDAWHRTHPSNEERMLNGAQRLFATVFPSERAELRRELQRVSEQTQANWVHQFEGVYEAELLQRVSERVTEQLQRIWVQLDRES